MTKTRTTKSKLWTKKGFKKAVKYYFSQTSDLYYRPLIKGAVREVAVTNFKATMYNAFFRGEN